MVRFYGLWLFVVSLAAIGLLALGCATDDDDGPIIRGDDEGSDDDDDTSGSPAPETSDGFAFVPPGTFLMGSPPSEPGHRPDEARHEVTLTRAFEIQQTEVTQGEFTTVLGYNPSHFPVYKYSPYDPVEQVTWYDALAFADRLSERAGYAPCYALSDILCADDAPGDTETYCSENGGIADATVALDGVETVYDCEGFRLPTEAEWEHAARAGTVEATYAGDVEQLACSPVDPVLHRIAWYCGNADKTHHPVGTKEPNGWELFDMLGNVMEWTWDGYARDIAESATDPEGLADAHYRTVRGGAFRYYGGARTRAAYRTTHTPGYRIRSVGLRVVRTLHDVDASEYAGNWVPDGWEDEETGEPDGPTVPEIPEGLPFEFTRPDVGDPITPVEVTEFTRKITGFWKDTGFFDWILQTSHGIDASNPWGDYAYKLYWQDTRAYKTDGVVTFEHYGGADNLMIRTSKILSGAAAGYLMSGDEQLGQVVIDYSHGMVALFLGMLWDVEDPEDYVMARAIFTLDHAYTQEGGRQTYVEYDPAKNLRFDWNAHTIPNSNNPVWGDIWVRNMRSKDDVPHIMRTVPTLMYVVRYGQDEQVRDAAAEALAYLQGFARDIMESGYYIRTKDMNGDAYVPLTPDGLVNDLASFELYDPIAPGAECDPKLTSSLIAYGDPLNVYCGNGIGELYEAVAATQHYFNWAIIRYFHTAAALNALVTGNDDVAYELLEGLAERHTTIMNDDVGRAEHHEWDADAAGFFLSSATAGLPLTSEEARLIQDQYAYSADHYSAFPNWDLWDSSVPDGPINYVPSGGGGTQTAVRLPEMVFPIEYCNSPFRNESGAQLVDCDIVGDPSRWGEED